jgi:regulator of protease activity HflC (stomatin/prohibitin superfamily)
VFAAFSLGAVPPLYYGIQYNLFNKQADIENVHGPGRYFIFPWNTFVVFPASVQTIEFTNEARLAPDGSRFPALHSRTKEGLALHLQVSLQYMLSSGSIGKLYAEFNKNYEQIFTATVRDTLIKAASRYEAFQLWEERETVGAEMQEMVDKALKPIFGTCWGLQLMAIDLPPRFEASIVQTQVHKQMVSTRQYQQEATRVRAQTTVIAAQYNRNVTVIKAEGTANYTYATKEAAAKARSKTIGIESKVLGGIKKNLELSPSELVRYQRFSVLNAMENATVFYGFEDNTQVMLTAQMQTPRSPSTPDVPGVPSPSPTPAGTSKRSLMEQTSDEL